MNIVKVYNLPAFADPEGSPVTISLVGAPSFATVVANSKLSFIGRYFADINDYTITVSVSDSQLETLYTFTLHVFNNAPMFKTSGPSDEIVNLNTERRITLPEALDNET